MKTLNMFVLALVTVSVLSPAVNAVYDSKIEVKSIDKFNKGQRADVVVAVLNAGQTTKIGEMRVGSNSTGHKTKNIVLEAGELKKYNFSGFTLTENEETFTVTMTHLGENVIEPIQFEVTLQQEGLTNGGPVAQTLSKGILILIGIIIITIVGIILMAPFFEREGAKPFKGNIKFDKIIKKD